MNIAPAIQEKFPHLNDAQRRIVGHIEGPLLVIAGPGSGKTYSIVLRALNLLLLEKAQPRQIILCTFTDKAAFELRDRLAAAARQVGYTGDLSELTASTIHSFCSRVLTQHRHRTELGHSFDTLDELTQLLFIFEHFDEIIGAPENDLFLFRWKTRWTAIEGARSCWRAPAIPSSLPSAVPISGTSARSWTPTAPTSRTCNVSSLTCSEIRAPRTSSLVTCATSSWTSTRTPTTSRSRSCSS